MTSASKDTTREKKNLYLQDQVLGKSFSKGFHATRNKQFGNTGLHLKRGDDQFLHIM